MNEELIATAESAISECSSHLDKLQDSAQYLQRFRKLRNNLAHDYPENLQQTADTVNELLEHWQELEEMYINARTIYRARFPSSPRLA